MVQLYYQVMFGKGIQLFSVITSYSEQHIQVQFNTTTNLSVLACVLDFEDEGKKKENHKYSKVKSGFDRSSEDVISDTAKSIYIVATLIGSGLDQ